MSGVFSNSGAEAAARAQEEASRQAAQQAATAAKEAARQAAAQTSALTERDKVSQEVAALAEKNKPLETTVDLAPEALTTTTRKRQRFSGDSTEAPSSIRI